MSTEPSAANRTEMGPDEAVAVGPVQTVVPTGLPDITLHSGRHTFVTLLSEAGAPVDDIQHAAGHSSITVTMDRYRHPVEDAVIRTSTRLQAYIDDAIKAEAHDPRGAP